MNVVAEAPERPTIVRALAVLLTICVIALICAGSAQAQGIDRWEAKPSSTQAGGHPDLELHVSFGNRASCSGCSDARNLIQQLPTGFIGSPSGLPQCSLAQFATKECPPDTQIGVFGLFNLFAPELGPYTGQEEPVALYSPLYNLPPHPTEAALIGFVAPVIAYTSQIGINARTESDYGLEVSALDTYRVFAPVSVDVWLWGVPALPIHDNARFSNPVNPLCIGRPYDQVNPAGVLGQPGCHPSTPSNAPPIPFLNNPSACGVPLSATIDLTFYNGVFATADSPWPATTGCDLLSFSPSFDATPTTGQAETASGLEAEINVPQSQSPTVPTPSQIRATRVSLPPGFTLNANAADGKTACTDEEAAFGTRDEAKCPETSKIGTAILETTSLPGPIRGGIYLGAPLPGNRYRIFLTADGYATHVKLPGVVRPNPATGQLETAFEDLPQAPFQRFGLHFFGAERGVLVTPGQCGEYPVKTEFVPWDAVLPNQISTSKFTVDSGPNGGPCPNGPRPFAPTVKAGVVDNTGGGDTSFGFRLSRTDSDQYITGTGVKTPPGLLASLRGIPYCPEAALATLRDENYSGYAERASSACPQASHVGRIFTTTGAGSRPLSSPGDVYLAGPYKGAPLSFAFVVPATSGPYDLGNVLVRAAVYVDPLTAQVKTVTDPIPQIIGGIPLRLRTIQVELDRPEFIRNPTNCDPFSVVSNISGDEGGQFEDTEHFQVANCASLPFAPKLKLKMSGGIQRRGHPAITAIVQAGSGEANMKQVSVRLPSAEQLDNAHIGAVCTRVEFAHESCPEKSRLGTAEARTPLLDQPLRGPVYLRASSHRLPDLAISLKGQIEIQLSGRVDAVKGALRTTFESIPDAPVSSFRLSLAGGKKGLIVNASSLCAAPKPAVMEMTGQSGVTLNRRVKLDVACGAEARAKAHRGSKRGR
jgi:hypothetical protein